MWLVVQSARSRTAITASEQAFGDGLPPSPLPSY
jgi:hypothetical protein